MNPPDGPGPDRPSADRPVALVAGASRGLGLLVARELGERGFHVVICARDADELIGAEADLTAHGVEVSTHVCDVSDHERVEAMVEVVETTTGPIEVMICVAGVIQVGPLDSLSRKHFASAVDIMLWGPINTCLAVLPAMRRRGRGRIGVISSVGGLVAVPHLLPYSTAKFGAVGFSRGLRAELTGTGVKVTTVAPGLMRTGSQVRAQFVGDHAAEYAWFAAGASLPGISMDAERAARAIVSAVLSGRAMLVLTPLAQVGMRVNALLPGLTAVAMGVAARLLPRAPADGGLETIEGWQAQQLLKPASRTVVDRLTILGNRAAARFRERD